MELFKSLHATCRFKVNNAIYHFLFLLIFSVCTNWDVQILILTIKTMKSCRSFWKKQSFWLKSGHIYVHFLEVETNNPSNWKRGRIYIHFLEVETNNPPIGDKQSLQLEMRYAQAICGSLNTRYTKIQKDSERLLSTAFWKSCPQTQYGKLCSYLFIDDQNKIPPTKS